MSFEGSSSLAGISGQRRRLRQDPQHEGSDRALSSLVCDARSTTAAPSVIGPELRSASEWRCLGILPPNYACLEWTSERGVPSWDGPGTSPIRSVTFIGQCLVLSPCRTLAGDRSETLFQQ